MTNFPTTLKPMPTPIEMSAWDKLAIDFGIPETMLMENASWAILNFLIERDLLNADRPIWLFMGNGNNGGDAAALARHLAEKGLKPIIFSVSPIDRLKGAAAWHTRLAIASGIEFSLIPDSENYMEYLFRQLEVNEKAPGLLIDGLLGTGFKGPLRAQLQNLILAFNQFAHFLHCRVIAIDTPSGLNCLTGQAEPIAVTADFTITLAAAKPGLVLHQAKAWTGTLVCRGIGLPKGPAYPCSNYLLDASVLADSAPLPPDSYKNKYGHVYILAGSKGLEGAAHLASLGALRAGCGLVSVYAPEALLPSIKAGRPEIMTHMICNGEKWPVSIPKEIQDTLRQASSIIIGPGMGRTEDALDFLKAFLQIGNRPPTIFDADSLILLSKAPELVSKITARDILTPHPGEAGALLGCSNKEIQQDRKGALEKLKSAFAATVILKGAGTLISQKNQCALICPYDIPQLAIGGSGDVLSGCCGAKLAREPASSLKAGALAVIHHAIAGMICAGKYPNRGNTASDLLEALPEAFKFVETMNQKDFPRGILPWPPFPLPH